MKIDKKIVKYRVRKPDDKSADAKASARANDPDVFRDKNGRPPNHSDAREARASGGPDRINLKIKTPVSIRNVRDEQRHRLNEGHRARAARPLRFHQFEELDHFNGSFSDEDHLGVVRKGGESPSW